MTLKRKLCPDRDSRVLIVRNFAPVCAPRDAAAIPCSRHKLVARFRGDGETGLQGCCRGSKLKKPSFTTNSKNSAFLFTPNCAPRECISSCIPAKMLFIQQARLLRKRQKSHARTRKVGLSLQPLKGCIRTAVCQAVVVAMEKLGQPASWQKPPAGSEPPESDPVMLDVLWQYPKKPTNDTHGNKRQAGSKRA